MSSARRQPVLLDTSVLINFLATDRIDLLADHPRYCIVVTEHVRREVTSHYQEQTTRLEAALRDSALEETRVESVEELALFAQLTGNPRLGLGECAAIAAAIARTQPVAIDDKAARKAGLELDPGLQMMDTQAIVLSLVRLGTLTVQQADALKDAFARDCSFQLKIASFRDLL